MNRVIQLDPSDSCEDNLRDAFHSLEGLEPPRPVHTADIISTGRRLVRRRRRSRILATLVVVAAPVIGPAALLLNQEVTTAEQQQPTTPVAQPSVVSPSDTGPDAGTALRAVNAVADIDELGRPVRRPARDSGTCEGDRQPRLGKGYWADGLEIASVQFTLTSPNTYCSTLIKTEDSSLRGSRSYLALTVCNSLGECKSDWNDYVVDTGPLTLDAADGCLTWRVSVGGEVDGSWLIEDAIDQVNC